nr:tellurite resistance/C4-dicarboxylate transporter family protein [Streptomyces sp. LUP47B]
MSSAVADLNAGAFAFVMGTGIVSTGLNINGAHTASAVLLVVGLIGCAVLLPAYAWRLLRRRERIVADFVGPRGFSFLTIVIAADVMAARLAPDGHTAAAGAFLAFGAVGWLLLGYAIPLGLIAGVRRNPSLDHVNGAWFLWAVGSESVALAAAALAQQVSGRQLPVLALVCWGIGLVQYLLIAGMVLSRLLTRPVEPRSLMTSSWIFMGAAAITVLAGTRLLSLPSGNMLLSRPVIAGTSVVLWSFSTWLIPLLLALGVWRHVVRKVPFRYEFGWWNLVFPIGMYGVTTHELGRATGTSWMTTLGRWEIWVGALVWVAVITAMAATAVRAHLTTGHGGDAVGSSA